MYVTEHVALAPLPDRLHGESGLNVPVLFDERLTVPVGVRVPGAVSETVTTHEAGVLIVADELHDNTVLVDIGFTVIVELVVLELPL